jgi:hypothetical protein
MTTNTEQLTRDVRLYIFNQVALTGRVPQSHEISRALNRTEFSVRESIRELAAGRALILAPNDGDIWAANPFCAVPSGFRVRANSNKYWAICIWDALGIAAALHADALIDAPCGDCGAAMSLEVRNNVLTRNEGVVHFAVPAHHWWDNIGFT